MPDNYEANISTADALTLLLHNQHALAAAIEEITKWLSENGVESVAANAIAGPGNAGHECSRHYRHHHATTAVISIIQLDQQAPQ